MMDLIFNYEVWVIVFITLCVRKAIVKYHARSVLKDLYKQASELQGHYVNCMAKGWTREAELTEQRIENVKTHIIIQRNRG